MPMPDQVYSIFIKATPERVWQAITTSELRKQYFHGGGIESTFVKGASLRTFGADGLRRGDNVVLESDPPRLLVHTWRSLYDPDLAAEPESRVTWEIEEQPGGYC